MTPECPGSNHGRDTTIFRSFYIFSPVLILLILSIHFFRSIYFSVFNIYKKRTISIVECEWFGVKCLGYFFEPSPNELTALLIGSINLTRNKFEGNQYIQCKNRRVKAAHLMCQSNTKYVLKACPLF